METIKSKSEILEKLAKAVLEGNPEEVERLATESLKIGIDPIKAIEEGLSKGIGEAGQKFEKGNFFLPDLIMSAEAMKAGLKILEPELKKSNSVLKTVGSIVIGTVEGDIHDIGKSIVVSLLTAAGFKVYDLGIDVSVEKFVKAVKELKPDILGLSALLTVTTPRQRDVIEALKKEGVRDQVLVIVGGGSVTQEWANEIGADGYAPDGVEALKIS
jgi:trimethylamine corrinoid protein